MHGWTASSTTYTCFLTRKKAQIYLKNLKDGCGEEITEKQATLCLFVEGDDSSVADIERSVVAFVGCG